MDEAGRDAMPHDVTEVTAAPTGCWLQTGEAFCDGLAHTALITDQGIKTK